MKPIALAIALFVTSGCSGVGQGATQSPSGTPEETTQPTPATAAAPTPSPTPKPQLTAAATRSPAGEICIGPDVDWSQLPTIAQNYGRAWNERDDAKRADLIAGAMTEDASYVDPTTANPVVGAADIAKMIGDFHDGFGQVYFEPLPWAPTDQHHDRIRMRWRLCNPDGSIVWIGADFGVVEDGRISAITGFFNEPAAFEAEDGCTGPENTDWSKVPDVVRGYGNAWMAQRTRDRVQILDEIWAEDGFYANPFVESPVIGRAELSTHMAYGMGPGHYIEVTAWTENNLHHNRVWIPWRQCCPTGVSLVQGDDLGEIDASGRLSRVTSFWNNDVALPADVACD